MRHGRVRGGGGCQHYKEEGRIERVVVSDGFDAADDWIAERVKRELSDLGLMPEAWGGTTVTVEVSARQRKNLDQLLEMLLLEAEMLELKANPNRNAKGNVIESGLEPGGPTATVLVRKGTLRIGEVIICGRYYGRVRALISEEGKRLKVAAPSVAVKVLGLNGVPEAGLFSFWLKASSLVALIPADHNNCPLWRS